MSEVDIKNVKVIALYKRSLWDGRDYVTETEILLGKDLYDLTQWFYIEDRNNEPFVLYELIPIDRTKYDAVVIERKMGNAKREAAKLKNEIKELNKKLKYLGNKT